MFELSEKTNVNKAFKLAELFKAIKANKAVKDDAKNIVAVRLANVLSPATVNLKAGTVTEIYIFELELSDKNIPLLFLDALDKSVLFHTFFVLISDGQAMLIGANKTIENSKVMLGKYYRTDWQAETKTYRLPLSVGDLDGMYRHLFYCLIPLVPHGDEQICDFTNRYERICKLTKDIQKQQKLVDAEKQPKVRFELNDKLKELNRELEELK